MPPARHKPDKVKAGCSIFVLVVASEEVNKRVAKGVVAHYWLGVVLRVARAPGYSISTWTVVVLIRG